MDLELESRRALDSEGVFRHGSVGRPAGTSTQVPESESVGSPGPGLGRRSWTESRGVLEDSEVRWILFRINSTIVVLLRRRACGCGARRTPALLPRRAQA